MADNSNRFKILDILADGEFHSGEVLGERLGISRAAVAKHIKALTELDLDIFSVTGRGYKLVSSIALHDVNDIHQQLNAPVDVELLSVIPSTNTYLMEKIRNSETLQEGHTVLAECQTAGKGRRGRQWQSPFGSHIYMSRYVAMEEGLMAASGMSLAIGVAIVRAVKSCFSIEPQLKWPNDVLYQGQKLAGVLIEAEGQSDGICHLIVGVGINVNMPVTAASEIEQAWTDLNTITDGSIDRDKFTACLINELTLVIDEYKSNKLQNLHQIWNRYDAFAEQPVNLIGSNQVQSGICLGIDVNGALLLRDSNDQQIKPIYGGEISLRAKL